MERGVGTYIFGMVLGVLKVYCYIGAGQGVAEVLELVDGFYFNGFTHVIVVWFP